MANCQYTYAQLNLVEIESFFAPNIIAKNKIVEAKIEGWYFWPNKEIKIQTHKGKKYVYFDDKGRVKGEHLITDKGKDWTTGYYYESDTLRLIESANKYGEVFKTERYLYNQGLLDSINIKTWISSTYWHYTYDNKQNLKKIEKVTNHPISDISRDEEYYSSIHQLDSIRFHTGELETYSYEKDTILTLRYVNGNNEPYQVTKTILNKKNQPIYIESSICHLVTNGEKKFVRDYSSKTYSKTEIIYNAQGLIEKTERYHQMLNKQDYKKVLNGGIEVIYQK